MYLFSIIDKHQKYIKKKTTAIILSDITKLSAIKKQVKSFHKIVCTYKHLISCSA